jgi:hypothetical protein
MVTRNDGFDHGNQRDKRDSGNCVKKASDRHAVREMKDGPSELPCRRKLQPAVVNVMVKRRGYDCVRYG